jgi:hypothetical protein
MCNKNISYRITPRTKLSFTSLVLLHFFVYFFFWCLLLLMAPLIEVSSFEVSSFEVSSFEVSSFDVPSYWCLLLLRSPLIEVSSYWGLFFWCFLLYILHFFIPQFFIPFLSFLGPLFICRSNYNKTPNFYNWAWYFLLYSNLWKKSTKIPKLEESY